MKSDFLPLFQGEGKMDDAAEDLETEGFAHPDDERTDRLMELLDKVKASGGMDFIEMDGFLHGITCLPGFMPPSEYLSRILGEDAVLMSESELAETAQLIFWWWNGIQAHIVQNYFICEPWICPDSWDGGDEYDPDLPDDEEDGDPLYADEAADPEAPEEPYAARSQEELDATIAALDEELRAEASAWAGGFLGALYMGGVLDRIVASEEMGMYLVPALMLAKNQLPVEEDSPAYGQPLSNEDHVKALDMLPGSISALYRFLHKPVTRQAKLSRNAPCPCGSGKKYKKCCLGKPAAAG